jgi:hypothetical protein
VWYTIYTYSTQEAAGNIDISEKIEFVVEIEHSICIDENFEHESTRARLSGHPCDEHVRWPTSQFEPLKTRKRYIFIIHIG